MAAVNFPKPIKDAKVILLDLDNTLYPYAPCHLEALKRAYLAYRKFVEPISLPFFRRRYAKARKETRRRLRGLAASHSRLLYFQRLLESRLGRTDATNALRLEQAYWRGFLGRMRLHSWVRPFLRRCQREGKRIVIVTNLTAEIQMRKLQKMKLGKWIELVVSSEEAGVEKPDPAIFRYALKKADCRPHLALILGDDPKQDVCPPLRCLQVRKHFRPSP